MKMEKYQELVVEEQRELGVKITKLSVFLYADAGMKLEEQEFELLQCQLETMQSYFYVLKRRIDKF